MAVGLEGRLHFAFILKVLLNCVIPLLFVIKNGSDILIFYVTLPLPDRVFISPVYTCFRKNYGRWQKR